MTTNVTPAVLQAGVVLTTSAVAYITGPANSQVIVKRAVFNNTTAGAVTFTVYRVPSGGSVGTGNQIISARSISAGGTDLAPELANMVLNAGDTVQALASAGTSINMFASGFVAT
jgi:hypothetical protein